MNRTLCKTGFMAGIPIFLGYFPVAMAFGLLAKTNGIALGEAVSFSALVFAGASQFMALNLIQSGAAYMEIVIATLLLNFRHFLMSATVASQMEAKKKWLLPLVAFGITDETFAVAATAGGKLNHDYLIPLEVTAYSGWLSGTICGFLVGAALPEVLQKSMEIGLYAMFVAILLPSVRKNIWAGILAVAAALVHTWLAWVKAFPSGWNIIVAIVLVTGVGAWLLKEQEE